MLIDLHNHTLHLSTDSGLTLDELLARAKERGLDGVCLTEHNAVWQNTARLEAAGQRHGLAVFRGMEVNTQYGHVLVYGVRAFRNSMFNFDELCRVVESEGGVMVLAHPQWVGVGRPPTMDIIANHFHGIEVLNGEVSNDANGYVESMAVSLGKFGTGGSDSHSIGAVGKCATLFQNPVRNEEEMVKEMRVGRVTAVRLAPSSNGLKSLNGNNSLPH
ncbi:MAG: PHP domain-containing protein [Chloroflexi bacterium]|nr:PHP domain-containing protein [Chloroflexota bacterium]